MSLLLATFSELSAGTLVRHLPKRASSASAIRVPWSIRFVICGHQGGYAGSGCSELTNRRRIST